MSKKSEKLAKLLEEAVKRSEEEAPHRRETLKQVLKSMCEDHRGRLTLANTLTGEERTIAGDYYVFRAGIETLEQPLGELWGLSVQFSEDGEEIKVEAPKWEVKLQTEKRYREENSLPLKEEEE